jgi:hypothetical protein
MRLKEPFVLARTAQGRTLVVTGPWTSAAASLLSRGEVDGLTLNYALGFCESDLSFFGEWPIRRLQILDRLLVDLSPIERLSPSLEDLSVQVAPEARLNLAGFWNLRKLSGDWQLLRLALGQVQSLETLITWNFDEANLLPLIEHSNASRHSYPEVDFGAGFLYGATALGYLRPHRFCPNSPGTSLRELHAYRGN